MLLRRGILSPCSLVNPPTSIAITKLTASCICSKTTSPRPQACLLPSRVGWYNFPSSGKWAAALCCMDQPWSCSWSQGTETWTDLLKLSLSLEIMQPVSFPLNSYSLARISLPLPPASYVQTASLAQSPPRRFSCNLRHGAGNFCGTELPLKPLRGAASLNCSLSHAHSRATACTLFLPADSLQSRFGRQLSYLRAYICLKLHCSSPDGLKNLNLPGKKYMVCKVQ